MTEKTLPTLSIILPTYDEHERLIDAIKSLGQQEYPKDLVEILVIDDGSPEPIDQTSLIKLAIPFKLLLFRNNNNQGRAHSRNTGLRNASGEIIIFLDSDMTVLPTFFSSHVQMHREKSDSIGVGNIIWADEIPDNPLTRYASSRGVHLTNISDEVPFKCFVTGNSSVPKALLDRTGPFDEDFKTYGGEDLELGARLHSKGARFFYIPEALSYHHHSRPLKEFCQLMYDYGLKSLPIVLEKHPVLKGLLRLDFLDRSNLTINRILFRIVLLRPVYLTIFFLTRLGMYWYVPDLFFDYLIWYNRTRGYLKSLTFKTKK
ncbi:MAG: glycosyltransferase [Candidatus Latescibacterota bacterium]|nr:glycosyltransferase [Candidatus Latescibacterota bacterium]